MTKTFDWTVSSGGDDHMEHDISAEIAAVAINVTIKLLVHV